MNHKEREQMQLSILKLDIEIKTINYVLDEARNVLNHNSFNVIMDIRLKKQIAKINLEMKIRNG